MMAWANGATIYSDDKDVRMLAKTVKIEVIGLADLPPMGALH
jgi:hypothetical protein